MDARIWLIALFAVSLFCSVTNLVPGSLAFALGLLFVPVAIMKQKGIPFVLLTTMLLLFYFALSTLVYDPKAFLEYGFYRRDGNVFASLLPLLLFGIFCLDVNIEKIIYIFIPFATIVNIIVFFLYCFFKNLGGEGEEDCYFFLFVAHNAAGGFLSMLSALCFAWWKDTKSRFYLFCFITNAITLWFTHSRGSVVALFLALLLHIRWKDRYNRKALWLVTALTTVLLFITYPIWQELGCPDSFFSEGAKENAEQVADLRFDRSYTFLDRSLILWPRAIYLWLQSPLVGTGFGSYNDLPYDLVGVRHFAMINQSQEPAYDSGHAHHSFLHVLAETGLVGFGLTILMLISIHRFIQSVATPRLREGLLLMFWIAIWSSMTEHRLFTPAQMLPFTLLLGATIGDMRAKNEITYRMPLPWMQKAVLRLPKKSREVHSRGSN